ncbi:MAG TPA: hypothetical protein VF466_02140 [Candidatus Saccharimonadales bacterium]
MAKPRRPIETLPEAHFDFRREHGTHRFTLSSGERVTAVSQPSWQAFVASAARMGNPGDYLLTPELITVSPEPTPAEFPQVPAMLESRHDKMRILSRWWPDAILVLGSLTLDTPRPRNELLFLQGGQITGHNPKLPYLASEAEVFHQAYDPSEHQQPNRTTVGMICSDLLFHSKEGGEQITMLHRNLAAEYVDPIGPDVRTLLVSAAWITPYIPGIRPEQEGVRFIDPLQYAVRNLMDRHPGIQDVVMADQLSPGTPASGPVNFHAQRA